MLLRIATTADALEMWLGLNAGTSADWPVDIKVYDMESATHLALLMSALQTALKPYRAMTHNPDCDWIQKNPDGIRKPCNCDAGAHALLQGLPMADLEAAYRLAKADETDKGQECARRFSREIIRRSHPTEAPPCCHCGAALRPYRIEYGNPSDWNYSWEEGLTCTQCKRIRVPPPAAPPATIIEEIETVQVVHEVRCPKCGNYYGGHATGGDDICCCHSPVSAP